MVGCDMIPDYDFTLLFPPCARVDVLDDVKSFCDRESCLRLEAAKGEIVEAEVDLTLRSFEDMPVDIISQYRRLPDGGGCLGYIYLSIKRANFVEFPDAIDFRFWPCTRQLQQLCFGSMLLRAKLVELLKRHQGYAGYIRNESCNHVEFWHHSTGRANDEYPPEYTFKNPTEPDNSNPRV
jgi:hypothetical protein